MRPRLLIIVMLLGVFLSFSSSQVLAALKSLPVPKAPSSQGEFDTDLFTGSAGYNYSLELPKGTNDLTPEVSISYNSGSAKGISQKVGSGWNLDNDYIERDSNYTPGNTSDDKFKLHFKGQTHDLVEVYVEGIYHTKIESNLNIVKLTAGEDNESNEYWLVTTKDGTKYRFGQATNSELICNTRSYTYRWNLDLVEDTHGNKIFYTYSESNGASFLTKIEYNTEKARVVDFTYDTHPYQRAVYLQGCKVTEASRLIDVQIKANSNLVRKFDLKYATTLNGGQLLSSLVQKESSGSALPATKFSYNPQNGGFQSTDDKWLNNVQLDYTDLDRDDTRLIDVNGDALPDIVRSYGDSWITYKVWLNTGNTWSTQAQDWMVNNSFDAGLNDDYVELTDVTGDALPDIVKAASSDGWRVWRNTGTSWSTTEENWGIPSVHSSVKLSSSNVQLVDVNGDSLPDVVRSWWNGQRQWEVLKNTGSGWSNSAEVWSYGGIPDDVGEPDVRIVDVNGDSLPDLVKTSYSGTNATWSVYFNTGSSWETSAVNWINNANVDAHLEKNNVTLADVNGDGLTDIAKIIDQGTNDKWDVLLNKGNSWSTVWETWVTGVDADVEGEDNVKLSDVNGDTYPDIVKSYLNSGGNVTWQVWKNTSHATDMLSSIKNSLGGWTRFEYASTSAVFDNTGSDSLSDLPFGMPVIKKMTINNGMSGALGVSDSVTYSYKDGLYDWQDKEFRGFASVETVEPNMSKKRYLFNQSDSLAGLPAEIQTRDNSNNPYSEIEKTWGSYLNNGVYTVQLTEEKEYTFDGTESNPKVKATEYSYDNYGNVTKKSELGEPVVSGDERYTYNEYSYNPALWIVDKLAHSVVKSSNDSTKVSEKWLYYDNDPKASQSASAPSASKYGDGSDGNLTISSNTTESPIDTVVSAANSGSSIATISATTGFFPNQLVLFHQSQGTNVGAWEIARVESHVGNQLKLTTTLANSYASNSSANRAQVRVVPQYHNVTVNSGVTWTAKSWDGEKGGILAFLANGTVSVSGTINASQVGFRAGPGRTNAVGIQGEGSVNVGAQSTSANGSGGGGGSGGVWFGGGGGGGGGNAASGGAGNGGGLAGGGGAGSSVGTADLSTMAFGGAGGGGGSYYDNGGGGAGGKAGGIIFASASTFTINSGGAVIASAANGSNSVASGDSGGGGGGAGGSILLKAGTASLGSVLMYSNGGSGGSYNGSGGSGGAGSAGRIRVQYETSLSGTTNPSASTSQSTISNVPAGVLTWSGNSTNLTKGDLTTEIKWLEGGTNPVAKSEYDSYGNVTKTIDPNNNETTYTYNINEATRTYPERVTNDKGQQTNTTYDLGTGNILSKTDPNGFTTTYEYDVFGRVIKEIKPYDSSTYPTISYTYAFDGIAPESTRVSMREVSGTENTLDNYVYTDGMNRKIQTRTEAEDPSKEIVIDTYYDSTGGIKKETVPYVASSSALLSSPAGTKYGDGSDGNITISTNTTETPIDSSVNAAVDTSTAIVGSGLGFAANQIVLFHQTQGTNAGVWEFARVKSYNGTNLELTSALSNTYSSSGSNRAQVRLVRQYNNVTINSSVTWIAKQWDGSTGGILAFLASGTVTVNGIIDGKGRGFRGYSGHSADYTVGLQGEGTAGSGNIRQTSTSGNGGGGGGYSNNYPWDQGNGGGGGGNGTTGASGIGTGGGQNQGGAGGSGGGSSGIDDLSMLNLGGAGGAGGTGDSSGTSGGGSNGGAGVIILADSISVSGQITTEGNRGVDSNVYKAAGGGGGAGGSILIRANTASLGSGLLIAAGGSGGYHENSGRSDAVGGVGANGRIRVEYETSLSGSTSPVANTSQNAMTIIPGGVSGYANLDENAKHTEYTYDALGRVTIIENPKGDIKTTAYDHWKETDIDENGHIKRRFVNAYGKITKVQEVIKSISHDTNYVYNTMDQLTQIIDSASNSGTMTYDTLGRKTSQTDPDMGTWSYVYDATGNLTSSTDARNITIGRTYDELNRLTGVNYPTDTDLGFTYDVGKIGTLSVASDSAGTVSYTYDNRLRKTAETRVIGGTSKTTQFSYDSADRLTSQINPDSTESEYTFNNQGEIETLDGILDNVDYNALGKITKKEFDNGLDTNYTYDTEDFRLKRIQTGDLQDLNYTYDPIGNMTSIVDNIEETTKLFGYDDLDRLVSATGSADINFAYEYDPIGNLTKFTKADKEYSYAYGEGNAGPHAMTGLLAEESTSQQTATNYNAEYYNNQNLSSSPLFTRIDQNINFDWGSGGPTASMSADNFSVRWTKEIAFEEGTYKFSTTTDDGVRLYIDNQLVIDKWVGQSSVLWTATKQLSAGTHTIKMEYFEGSGGANAVFNYIKLTDDFTGEYFSNKTLSGIPTVIRNDAEINFDWHTASPAANLPYDNFSVRWNKVASFSAGLYKFSIRGDDGIRLYVDEQLIIDGWVDQSPTTYSTTKAMSAGNHRMRIEYYDGGWDAVAMFEYEKVGEAFTGEYFNNTDLSGSPVLTRIDPEIAFEWGDDAPHASVSANQYSVRWTKTEDFEPGDYEFTITGDDGIRLFIDDEEVIDGWFDQGPVSYSTVASMSGQHDIRVEYYEAWGGALAKFSYNKVSENVALNHTTASSSAASGNIGAYAVDGNPSTRWESAASDPQWVAVDLGSRKTINRVRIDWHADAAQEFKIQMSDNGTDWHNVKEVYWTNGSIDDVTGFYGTGRYIRLYGLYRATGNGYSVKEFEAYSAEEPTLQTPAGTPAIAYDANGNMISEGIRCYEYNNANKLTKVKRCANQQIIAEYVYDYNGQRLIKKNYNDGSLANTVISWSKGFETKATVGGSTETTNYFFANGEVVAKKNNDGSKVYFHNDHLGSNSLTTNQGGSQVEVTSYDPWGKVLGVATQSKFQFTGQEKDDETGLNYYNARYYSSDIRRFTQPDTIIQDVYNPQSLNRYSYAFNNPLKYIDPTGHLNILDYNNALTQYYQNPSTKNYNNALNTLNKIQKEHSNSSGSTGQRSGGSNSGSNNNSGQKNNSGSSNQVAGSTQNVQSPPEKTSVGQALFEGIRSSKANQVNSGGLCVQGSAAFGAGGGVGGSASACVQYTNKDGFVVTGSVGAHYVPAGASLGVGPAVTVSNAESAAELGGVDLVAGGSVKVGGGVQVDHARSIDPNNLGIWSTTANPQIGLGGDLHGGVTTTGVIDIPWF